MRWLLRYIASHTFELFAWYRIAFGLVLLAAAGPVLLWSAWRSGGLIRAGAVGMAGVGGFAGTVAAVFALQLAIAPMAPDRNVPAGVGDAQWVSPQLDDYFRDGRKVRHVCALSPAGQG